MATPTLDQIEKLIAAKENAEYKIEFAESIKCTASVIQGDRYKVVFSEASTEGDK